MKTIKRTDTIFEIVKHEPLLQSILVDLGFEPMRSNINLNTMGRLVTLNEAMAHLSLDLESVLEAFQSVGVSIDE